MGAVFVLLQVLAPVHQAVSENLGDRISAWLYDDLTDACVAPPGMGHLEDPELTGDITVARDFDLGMTGPAAVRSTSTSSRPAWSTSGPGWPRPSCCSATPGGRRCVLAGAWLATHWLLRESGVWKDRNTAEVREAQHDADYAYRLAVDPPAAKELRLFGLADWVLERFLQRRRQLLDLQYAATRLRERSLAVSSLLLVGGANVLVFWSLGRDVRRRRAARPGTSSTPRPRSARR